MTDDDLNSLLVLLALFVIGLVFFVWYIRPSENQPIKVPVNYTRCGEYMVPPVKGR